MVLGFLLHSPEVFPCAVPIYNPVGSAPHLCLAVREAQMTGVHYEVVKWLGGLYTPGTPLHDTQTHEETN